MLGPGRYLLGVVELLLWVGLAGLAAWRLRLWLVPRLRGAAAGVATALIAVAILVWAAELLGSSAVWEPVPYSLLLGLVAGGVWMWAPHPAGGRSSAPALAGRGGDDLPPAGAGVRWESVVVWAALLVAAVALVHFAGGVRERLGTGMTGFDSTWYHGPFAAGFFQSGDTWHLHFIAPQFLAWFYPANSEVLHAIGMLAFGRDILSPLLNLGWFAGCLVACWAIGRPYRVAPWSLALGAVALSVPALADQAGEARNDIVGIFFLLAAVAVALNGGMAVSAEDGQTGADPGAAAIPRLAVGTLAVVGLGAGLAAGTKLNFLLPAAVLVLGLVALAPRGGRWRALAAAGLPALAGGGYWYLRNLAHAGNPLPWVHHLGPISLSAPAQALGGREAHSVLGYLSDGSVWSDWFLPGLHHALWFLWPLLAVAALLGLLLPLTARRRGCPSVRMADRRTTTTGDSDQKTTTAEVGRTVGDGGGGPVAGVLALAGLVGLATALAWLVAPTSASGPDGMPRGFESGLRYLAPALVLGLALLPAAPPFRQRLASLATASRPWLSFVRDRRTKDNHEARGRTKDNHAVVAMRRPIEAGRLGAAALVGVGLIAVLVGYPVERHYLANRYKDPSFTAPGLNAAFAWARDVSGARIATTSTRQYPLFGSDLSNRVQYLGEKTAHGGFEAPPTCAEFVRLLNDGGYNFLIASRDRLEPGKPPYPPQARWAEGAGAEVIFRKPPTVVFRIGGPLDPSACR